MKYFKIYNENYPIEAHSDEPADMYGWKNDIVDEIPENGVKVGYVTMDDGSIIECYEPKKTFPIIVVPIAIVLIGAIGAILYFAFGYKGADNPLGTLVSVPVNQNIVHYDAYMPAQNGQLNVGFTNGEVDSVIKVTGEGIETKSVTVPAGQTVETIPIKVTSTDGAIEATLHIKSGATQVEYPVVIENTDALNENDIIDSNAGYWDKEEIFYQVEYPTEDTQKK